MDNRQVDSDVHVIPSVGVTNLVHLSGAGQGETTLERPIIGPDRSAARA
jgi:hypothetical protein